ncbi:hypothetical protein NDA16_004354 [Ustilago loliicola]|nr:hypothetical protein NDA16_004354 [Ustilago loliicola]
MTLFAAGYNGTIVPYSVNGEGSITQLSQGVAANSSGTSPSWIAYSTRHHSHDEHKDALYSVTDFYSVDETTPGRVFSHTYDPKSHAITQTGSATQRTNGTFSGGDGPVSCLIGHGSSKNLLFVANYNSGSASVIPIDAKDGSLAAEPSKVIQFTRPAGQPKIGPVADRQDHSYAHQVSISPSGKWVYVCDLGADQIHHLRIQDGQVEFVGSTDVEIGSGPRHITFYKDQKHRVFGYLASELDNKVSSFSQNEETGELKLIGTPILASPPGVPLSGEGILPTNRTTAEIAVVPAGDFVYVSDRGDMREDHISIFKRDQETGEVSFVEWVGSGGRMPRHFSLSSDTGKDEKAKYLAVGHQTDQNIVIFERDTKLGGLKRVAEQKDVGRVAFTGFSPF